MANLNTWMEEAIDELYDEYQAGVEALLLALVAKLAGNGVNYDRLQVEISAKYAGYGAHAHTMTFVGLGREMNARCANYISALAGRQDCRLQDVKTATNQAAYLIVN